MTRREIHGNHWTPAGFRGGPLVPSCWLARKDSMLARSAAPVPTRMPARIDGATIRRWCAPSRSVDDHPGFPAARPHDLLSNRWVRGRRRGGGWRHRPSRARTLKPDPALLDIQLPDLDGFAVCDHLALQATHHRSSSLRLVTFRRIDDGLPRAAPAVSSRRRSPDRCRTGRHRRSRVALAMARQARRAVLVAESCSCAGRRVGLRGPPHPGYRAGTWRLA